MMYETKGDYMYHVCLTYHQVCHVIETPLHDQYSYHKEFIVVVWFLLKDFSLHNIITQKEARFVAIPPPQGGGVGWGKIWFRARPPRAVTAAAAVAVGVLGSLLASS